jgi:hypothetical protein
MKGNILVRGFAGFLGLLVVTGGILGGVRRWRAARNRAEMTMFGPAVSWADPPTTTPTENIESLRSLGRTLSGDWGFQEPRVFVRVKFNTPERIVDNTEQRDGR